MAARHGASFCLLNPQIGFKTTVITGPPLLMLLLLPLDIVGGGGSNIGEQDELAGVCLCLYFSLLRRFARAGSLGHARLRRRLLLLFCHVILPLLLLYGMCIN